LVEDNRIPRENHRPVSSHWQSLSRNVVSSTPHWLPRYNWNIDESSIKHHKPKPISKIIFCNIYRFCLCYLQSQQALTKFIT
jgi:hypothetical protein